MNIQKILFSLIFLSVISCTEKSKTPKTHNSEDFTKNKIRIKRDAEIAKSNLNEIEEDTFFISKHVFQIASFKNDTSFTFFEITDSSDEADVKFNAITKNNFIIQGEITNDEDLHTAHFFCTNNDFNRNCIGRECISSYRAAIIHLSKIIFKDTLPIKIIACSENITYSSTEKNNQYTIFAKGGNFNEISIKAIDLKLNNIAIEFLVRDIGDLIGYKICDTTQPNPNLRFR